MTDCENETIGGYHGQRRIEEKNASRNRRENA